MISRSPSSESIVSSKSPRMESTGNIQQAAADPMHSLNSPLPQISTIPSAMPSWETSPQSPSSDKQRPFKSKSKHNLAVFGAKLTSTAASVGVHTSKYKQKEKDALKESKRESLFMDELEVLSHSHDSAASIIGAQSPNSVSTVPVNVGGSNGSGSGGMLKSKMFKQSKSDLKSLRIKTDLGIQAARSTLNDRSPMVRGGSTKELDRIAAIGQVGSITQPNDSITGGNAHHHHHLHHPHISFRKRDSPAAVLSSSASNSILASEGTVYSFNQSNNNGPPSALASLHSFKTVEEGTAFLTSSWTLLNLRIQSLFKRDEALRIPVEDVNILVLMHFSAHYALAGTGLEILKRLDELLETGLKSSSIIPKQATLESLADSWQYFFSNTLISLEAIFLPLQLEFDAVGQVFTSSQAARDYWYPLAASRPSTSSRTLAAGRSKPRRINMRRRILTIYRDVAVAPHLAKLTKQIDDLDSQNTCSGETLAQVLQCFTTLSRLHSEGEAQKFIESSLQLIQEGLMKKRKLQGELKGASGSRRV